MLAPILELWMIIMVYVSETEHTNLGLKLPAVQSRKSIVLTIAQYKTQHHQVPKFGFQRMPCWKKKMHPGYYNKESFLEKYWLDSFYGKDC